LTYFKLIPFFVRDTEESHENISQVTGNAAKTRTEYFADTCLRVLQLHQRLTTLTSILVDEKIK